MRPTEPGRGYHTNKCVMACLLRTLMGWLSAIVLLHCTRLTQAVILEEYELMAARFVVKPDDVIFDPFAPTPEVRLSCNSTGEQPVTYTWRKDRQLLALNSRQPPYELDAGALIIKSPEKSKDEGDYQCLAENDYGKVISRRTALTFAYTDEFDPAPRAPVSGRQGEGAVLRCQKPDAYPGLMFFWVESGSFDPAFTSTDQRVYVSMKTGDLYFAQVEPGDSSSYQCVVRLSLSATSPLRELSPTVSLSVAAQTPPQSAPNLVLDEGDSISSVTGDTVLMEGFAYGNPIPTLTWRRLDAQGNEVAMPPADRLITETWNRALVISDVKPEDAGFYEVTATNSLGSQSQRTQLILNAGPLFIKDLSDQNHRLDLGESVTWNVVWDVGNSTEPVDVVWLHNAEILAEGGRYRMTRSGNTASLQITDLTEEDSGAYQCSISNIYGRTRSSAELHSGAPSYVSNMRLIDSGDDYAVLGWDPPLGSDDDDIAGYQVQAIPKDGGDVRTLDVGPGDRAARIDGLNSGSGGYTYRVRARSSGGTWGPWTTLGDDRGGSGDPGARSADSTSQLLAWLLPLLIVLLLLLLLLCCCCCLWLGLCGKYCPCCTCFDRTESKPYKAMSMRKDHQEMLKLYRPDAVKHVQNPDRITGYLASKNVRLPTGMSAIKKPRTREDRHEKLLDNLIFGEDDAFEGYCAALREEEKLYWLADTLEGPGLPVDRREQLMRHQTVLVEKMDPDVTLAHLSKQKVFTTAMSDYVSSADTREEKNRRIIHLLQSRDEPDFYTFCGALRQNESQAHLADLLQEEGLDLNKSVLLEEKSLDNATIHSELDSKGYSREIHGETHRFTHTTVTKTQHINEVNQQNSAVQWQASNGGVYIMDQRREADPIQRQLSLTDPTIRSGASAVARRGQAVILEVNGEVDDAHWLLNDGPLPQNKGIHVRTYGLTHELNIDGMTPELSGTYTCQGYTPDGAMLTCDIGITLLDSNPSL
ncbi:CNTN5 [Branchiostoma lanceolatum]|uniref:CNTN5 protein n=1 Tax=Branchiostoma lanceolatum TaxID=7740 RepID=A0A8K0EMI5_BRALA|nr:CNTN5 [Branchiostoma lanceolatum]